MGSNWTFFSSSLITLLGAGVSPVDRSIVLSSHPCSQTDSVAESENWVMCSRNLASAQAAFRMGRWLRMLTPISFHFRLCFQLFSFPHLWVVITWLEHWASPFCINSPLEMSCFLILFLANYLGFSQKKRFYWDWLVYWLIGCLIEAYLTHNVNIFQVYNSDWTSLYVML